MPEKKISVEGMKEFLDRPRELKKPYHMYMTTKAYEELSLSEWAEIYK